MEIHNTCDVVVSSSLSSQIFATCVSCVFLARYAPGSYSYGVWDLVMNMYIRRLSDTYMPFDMIKGFDFCVTELIPYLDDLLRCSRERLHHRCGHFWS